MLQLPEENGLSADKKLLHCGRNNRPTPDYSQHKHTILPYETCRLRHAVWLQRPDQTSAGGVSQRLNKKEEVASRLADVRLLNADGVLEDDTRGA